MILYHTHNKYTLQHQWGLQSLTVPNLSEDSTLQKKQHSPTLDVMPVILVFMSSLVISFRF